MARALKVPGNRLRLRTPPDSGGSFGVKQAVFPYIVLMGVAARVAGRPVKWVEDRLEHLAASVSATNRVSRLEAAVDADGRVRALRYDQIEDVGAHIRAPEPATLYRMHGTLTGAYDIRHVAVRNRVVLTNKTPTGLNRGFGGPQMYYALERLMQRIAVELEARSGRRDPAQSGAGRCVSLSHGDRRATRFRQLCPCRRRRACRRRLCRIVRAPRPRPRRGPHLRHRLHRRGRAQRVQHGLHHHRADAGGAAARGAEERCARDRDRGARSARIGQRACGERAARPGPPHGAGPDRRPSLRAQAARHSRRHRDRHRARRLVDRVGQLFEPLCRRGRRRDASRRDQVEGQARAHCRGAAQCRARGYRIRQRARRRARQSRQQPAVRPRGRHQPLGAGDRRGRKPGVARDRVLDAAGTDPADASKTRSIPRSATASFSISAASRSTASPARCASTNT